MHMPGKAFAISIILMVHVLHMLAAPTPYPLDGIKSLYRKADKFFNLSHPTPETDLMALNLFGKVIEEAENTRSLEELLFQSYIKKGVLLDVKGSYTEALTAYAGALRCFRRHPDWNDSLLFKVYIYAGPDYYHLDNFDTAYSMLNKAELLTEKYPTLQERDRLYNALGALYYESGNYLQGRNYFNRALEIIRKEKPDDKTSTINFGNNIASCLYKLGAYRESLEMYRHLGQFGKYSDEIYLIYGQILYRPGRLYACNGPLPKGKPGESTRGFQRDGLYSIPDGKRGFSPILSRQVADEGSHRPPV